VSATRISLIASSSSFLFAAIVYMYATHTSLNSTFVLDIMTQLQKCQEGMGFFSGESKTAMKLHCDCCGKLLLFKSVQEVFTEVDDCMLHISAPPLQEAHLCTSAAVNISFQGYFVFQHHFCLNKKYCSTPLTAVEIIN
jgi:hypothetical protein